MAEGRCSGRRTPATRERRYPTRRCHLTDARNIFLHNVLDDWFERDVRPRMAGGCTLVRYADDFVMTFKHHRDALGKRLARYGLTLHPKKTRFIDFRPVSGETHPECKPAPFDFLGFTHTWAKSRKGKNVVRQRTAKSRLARALIAVNEWCRTNRHQLVRWQHARLRLKLQGHYAYYGITGNMPQLDRYRTEVTRLWRKWLARRPRSKRLPWERFKALLARYPLPSPQIIHCYANVSQALP